MLLTLLKFRLYRFANHFTHGGTIRNRRRLLGFIAALFFSVWIFTQLQRLFSTFVLFHEHGSSLVLNFLIASFAGLFVFLLFSGIPVILHFFCLSKDTPLLLATPIKAKTLSQYKFIEATIANSAVFLYLGLPFLIAVGVAAKATAFYFILAALAAVLFLVIPTGLGTAIALLLLRLFSAKRAKNWAVAVMGIIFISIWAAFQFLRVSRLDPTSPDFNPVAWDTLSDLASHPYLSLLPSTWLAKIWMFLSQGDVGQAVVPAAGLFLLSLLLYALSIWVAAWAFQNDLTGNQAKSILFHRGKEMRSKVTEASSTSTHLPLFEMMRLNFRLLKRDPRQFTNLLLFLAMMIVLPFTAQTDARSIGEPWSSYYPFLFIVIFASLMAAGLSARMIPMEGYSFSFPMTAPQPMQKFITAKVFATSSVCAVLTFSTIIIVTYETKSSISVFCVVLAAVFGAILSSAGVGSCMGAAFAKFDWDHPKQMLQGSGNLVLSLITAAIFAIGILLIIAGHFLYNIAAGLAFFALYSLLLTFLGTHLASKRLERLEWSF